MLDDNVTRRRVLRSTVFGVAATGMAGIASATEQIEINVGFSNVLGKQAAQSTADSVKREFGFDAMTIRASRSSLSDLQANPHIRYAEENGQLHAVDQPFPWGIEFIDADDVIGQGETGNGVDIAIVDTGIDADHEDLAQNLGAGWAAENVTCRNDCEDGPACNPNDIDGCQADWDDDNDHGTHVAGIAGALDNDIGVVGVAPEITLHSVKVLDCCGTGSADDVAAGIEWAADQDHDVINLSLGGDAASVVEDAVVYAAAAGVIQVAAAGNEGEDDSILYPAAYDDVIAVGAIDENETLADFSSKGPELDLVAPGVDVPSTIAGDAYAERCGTSMASPHVAGGAAHLVANGYDAQAARDRLEDTAVSCGLTDDEEGNGRIDIAAALDLT